jgi:hypothetical protein
VPAAPSPPPGPKQQAPAPVRTGGTGDALGPLGGAGRRGSGGGGGGGLSPVPLSPPARQASAALSVGGAGGVGLVDAEDGVNSHPMDMTPGDLASLGLAPGKRRELEVGVHGEAPAPGDDEVRIVQVRPGVWGFWVRGCEGVEGQRAAARGRRWIGRASSRPPPARRAHASLPARLPPAPSCKRLPERACPTSGSACCGGSASSGGARRWELCGPAAPAAPSPDAPADAPVQPAGQRPAAQPAALTARAPHSLLSSHPPQGAFPSNELVTARYNVLSFLPVNLYSQFKRVANLYFLALVCLQVCGWWLRRGEGWGGVGGAG